MESIEKDESKCQCYKNCSQFQQILKLKNTGLVIYRYSSHKDENDVKSNDLEKKTIGDVYVFHNTSSLDITTNKYLFELEEYIKCARCKYIFEQAYKLLRNISDVSKVGVVSLCDCCKCGIKNDVPCKHCYEAVKKFIVHKNKKTEDSDDITQLENKFKLDYNNEINKRKSILSSKLLLNVHRNFKSHPELFNEHKDHLLGFDSDVQIRVDNEQRYEHLLKKNKRDNFSRHLDSTFTNAESFKYAKELRLINSNNKKNELIGYSDKTYRLRKNNELNLPSKYVHISLDDINAKFYDFDVPFLRIKSNSHTTLNYQDNTEHSNKYSSSKIFKQNLDTFDPNNGAEKILVQVNKDKLLQFNSEVSLVSFNETLAQGSLNKNFSFFFIKKRDQPKYPKIGKSSSELIKETQDVILAKAKKEKQELRETNNLLKKSIITDNQPKETKIKSKEIEMKDEKIKTEEGHLKLKPLIDEKKDKVLEKVKKTLIDKKIDNANFDKLSQKNTKKNESTTSLTIPKKEKSIVTKSKQKINNTQTEILEFEKESKKFKNTQDERQKVKKEQKERTKKDEAMTNKDEYSTKEEDKTDNVEEFKKILAQQKKEKEEEKRVRKIKEDNHKIKRDSETVTKDEVLLKSELSKSTKKQSNETKTDVKPAIHTTDKLKFEDRKTKDLQMNQITVRTPSTDDLILRLVKLKQSYPRIDKERPKHLSQINIDPNVIAAHKCHRNKQLNCIICNDSDLELDIENIMNKKSESTKIADIIVGEKILKYKPHLEQKINKPIMNPLLFSSTLQDDVVHVPEKDFFTDVTEGFEKKALSIRNVSA